ncbi:translation elongation factor Ts [Patescibacteria group bacterium]|nr:translation elongation factor Ts [Patescibacteria group bacterium]
MDASKVKELREKTGVSVMLCKKALEDSGGDEVGAMEWLKKQGVEAAEKKSGRSTKAGVMEAYIHNNGQIGVLVELRSETDFVAKNPDFKEIAHNIALHIAASCPDGTKDLLEQPYIKNPEITIAEYLNESIQRFGENIEIARFERFVL